MRTAWGSVAPVTVAQPVDVIGWSGLVATLTIRHPRVEGFTTERSHGRHAGSETRLATSGVANRRQALGPRSVVASDPLNAPTVAGVTSRGIPPVSRSPPVVRSADRDSKWAEYAWIVSEEDGPNYRLRIGLGAAPGTGYRVHRDDRWRVVE